MATKTLTITEDAYRVLARQKHKDESFSKEIIRLLDKKGSIMDFAGAWAHLSDKEAEEIEKAARLVRKSWSGKRYDLL